MPDLALTDRGLAVLDALASPPLVGRSVPSIEVGHAALLSHAVAIALLRSLRDLGLVEADTSAHWKPTSVETVLP